MAASTPLDKRLDQDEGDSFVERLNRALTHHISELQALLAATPSRWDRFIHKLAPNYTRFGEEQDELPTTLAMVGRQRAWADRLSALQGLVNLMPPADKPTLIQRGLTSLTSLAGVASLPFIDHLVAHGGDVHQPDPANGGLSPFMAYLNGPQATFSAALIERHGARPRQTDDTGETALDWVAANGYIANAWVLVRAGWDPERISPRTGKCPVACLRAHVMFAEADAQQMIQEARAGRRLAQLVGQPASPIPRARHRP